jgi:hypothetical protein
MKSQARVTVMVGLMSFVVCTASAIAQGTQAEIHRRARCAVLRRGQPVHPVHAYFARQHGGWKLVGFERVPNGNAATQSGRK